MGDNNIVIKITSEADLTQAQKQIDELTKEAAGFEKQLDSLSSRRKADADQLKKEYAGHKNLSSILKKNEELYRQEKRDLKASIAERKQSIKALQDQVKSYKTLNGMSGKAVQQLRAMREELMKMEDAGEFGTEAFMNLSIAAAELEDKISDTQQRIRALASDTKELDAISGIGETVASSFNIMTSSAELLGNNMEGLQKAFYKVQAVMSIVNGLQSMSNLLNKNGNLITLLGTGIKKLFNKETWKGVAATSADTASTVKNITIKKISTVVTNVLRGSVRSLWATLAANPLGAVMAAVGALVSWFITMGSEEDKVADSTDNMTKAQKRLENAIQRQRANEAKRNYDRQRQIDELNKKEEDALTEAKKRNASEIELAAIKANFEKQRAEEAKKYVNDSIDDQERVIQAALDRVEEVKKLDEMAKKGFLDLQGAKLRIDKDLFAEELAQANEDYYNALAKRDQTQKDLLDAKKASLDSELELEETRRQMRLEASRINIELMRDGAAKEIAQIKLDYNEKLRNIQGNGEEEIKLRKALEAKKAREIEAVRKKYALQEQQAAIQEQKNLLESMSRSRGTEKDYAMEIELTKKIAEAEAKHRIDSLDKRNMAEKEYAAEVEAIQLDLAKKLRDIDEDEIKRKEDNKKRLTSIALAEAEARKNALTGAEGVDEQKAIVEDYYAYRRKQIKQEANFEKREILRSTETEEVKAAKIREIDAKMQADLEENRKESAEAQLAIDEQYLTDLEIAVSKAEDKLGRAQTTGDRLSALREQKDAQLALYDEQQRQLKAKWDAGLISFSEYKQQEWEITKATTDAEVEYQTEAMNAITDGFQTALEYMQQASDLVFEALSSQVQAELDALDEMYTTDWEEAQKNADKKYITEKEYEKKKAALEEKQAKYAKAQALINGAINTAQAIITTLAQFGATPWGIASAAIAGAMGAAQLAIIANRPLAQYEKGRKGGKGEYAIVGEKGPEIMYIPRGASIIPNNKIEKPAEWAKFGVPELPHSNPEILRYVSEQAGIGLTIDYDRMGASVAKHLPKQRNVTVNVDRSGVSVNDGSQHTYLNAKYNGSWS